MDAERLTCSVLDLSGTTIIGHAEGGAVNLTGAHIGGQFGHDAGTDGQTVWAEVTWTTE